MTRRWRIECAKCGKQVRGHEIDPTRWSTYCPPPLPEGWRDIGGQREICSDCVAKEAR
jgi:hypothetical protein